MMTDFAVPKPRAPSYLVGWRLLPGEEVGEVQTRASRWTRRAAVRAAWGLRTCGSGGQELPAWLIPFTSDAETVPGWTIIAIAAASYGCTETPCC